MKTKKTCMKKKLHYGFYSFIIISLLNSAISFSQLGIPTFKSALEEIWKNGDWENSANIINKFDGKGYLTNSLTQGWENASWVKTIQINYNNNSNGTVHQSTAQNWTTQWNNIQRTTYTYTPSNLQLSTINEMWIDPNWLAILRTTNTYDGNNYLIKEVTESYNFVTWGNSTQTLYENNSDGTVKIETSQNWLAPNWVNNGKTSYDYYAGKKEKTATYQIWDTDKWVNSELDTNTYNGNGNVTNTLSQQWNVLDSSWLNDSQSLYTGYATGSALPKQVTTQDWVTDGTGSKWVNSFRITINYDLLNTRDFEFEKNYTLYPNPTHNFINISNNNQIQGSNYSVIDQTGRKCISGALNSNETAIDLNNLNNGIYFVQLGQNKNQTFKIIKE